MIDSLARHFARLFWATGLPALARSISSGGKFVLEFHGVPRNGYMQLPAHLRPILTASHLEEALRWVSRRFRFLTPDEFLKSASPGVLLTFDDGFANHHDVVLPLLDAFNAPAVFFVATQHIGNDEGRLGFVEEAIEKSWGDAAFVPKDVWRDLYDGLDEKQIRRCVASGLVTIGAHSVSHPRLTGLDDRFLLEEIRGSKCFLEDLTGRKVDLFAYPFGAANPRVARFVEEAGFQAAFAEDKLTDLPLHMAIPRVGLYGSEPWYLSVKLSGLVRRPIETKWVISTACRYEVAN
jgi:peptidoglycan/xylan/chitin deacetylase (PgdA/CDA1 family)